MTNINDPRSTKGIYSRGKNIYNGTSTTPNPVGKNQHKFNPVKAAALRRKKMQKLQQNSPFNIRRQI